MNIRELNKQIEEFFYNIYEHANSRKLQKERIWNLSEEIYEHLAKIIMFGNEHPTTVHHWCSEIVAHLRKCMRSTIKMEKKPRYPKESELYSWLTDNLYVEDMLGLKNYLAGEYKIPNITDEELYGKIIEGYQLIVKLAVNQQFNVNIYEHNLNKLILR